VTNLNELRRLILRSAAAGGEGHVPSSLSVLDILWVAYDRILKIDPAAPADPARDRFILSKGHAALGLYAVLAKKGFFPVSELERMGLYAGPLGGHPDRNKVPGVEASTGSLGHGFPMSVGVALGLRILENDARVFALIGDGEANEGSVWEAALLAAHHGLSNLCCIVDYNHSNDRALKLGDLAAKFAAFGWETRVIDGHAHDEIEKALRNRGASRPVAVVANTVKGRGCRRMENEPAWHHRAPTAEELNEMLLELERA
jgi:transketolase